MNSIGFQNDNGLCFSPQLIHKLSPEAPPKILVERYLIEIAKNYNVPYEPDAIVRVSGRIPWWERGGGSLRCTSFCE